MSDGTVVEATTQTALERVIEASADQFTARLPAHVIPARFQSWAIGYLRRGLASPDEKQRAAWARVLSTGQGQASVMHALYDCAALGLEPGREYHLVPFGGEVTGITDYKGEIRLITNAQRCAVVAQLVRKTDTFHMVGANAPPRHGTDDWFAEPAARGPVVGGYSYVDFGGERCSQVCLMTEAEFLHHRDKAKTKSVWDEWPEAMRLKTLVHQVRKWVPWSAEWRP